MTVSSDCAETENDTENRTRNADFMDIKLPKLHESDDIGVGHLDVRHIMPTNRNIYDNILMNFFEGNIYHVYNRGNNRHPIFFERRNYVYFRDKIEKYICPCCDLLAWVLMPNHFHFLVYANELTTKVVRRNPVVIDRFTEGMRILLSSYTKGLQRQEGMTGNLFQQNTKSKCVSDRSADYSLAAFQYIHQNPYRAGLVEKFSEWEFSSLHEYLAPGTSCFDPGSTRLCNVNLARKILSIGSMDIGEQTSSATPQNFTNNLYHKKLETKT